MFWLKFVAIGILITVGIFLIAWLEEIMVSGPRRRETQRRAMEKLKPKPKPAPEPGTEA